MYGFINMCVCKHVPLLNQGKRSRGKHTILHMHTCAVRTHSRIRRCAMRTRSHIRTCVVRTHTLWRTLWGAPFYIIVGNPPRASPPPFSGLVIDKNLTMKINNDKEDFLLISNPKFETNSILSCLLQSHSRILLWRTVFPFVW